jgi:Xaa-Pro aminopeptidase
MIQKGFDGLIIYDDDRPQVPGGNVRYVSDFFNTLMVPVGVSFPSAVVCPKNGDLILITTPGVHDSQVIAAKESSPIKDVRGTPLSGNPWVGDFLKDIKEALEKSSLTEAKIGINGLNIMPISLYRSLSAAFPKVKFTDATGTVETARRIKSQSEIEVIKKAAALSALGIEAFLGGIKNGVYQREACAKAEFRVMKRGAESTSMPMAAGVWDVNRGCCWWGMHRGDTKFETGDMVTAEFNVRWKGYWGQICRAVVVGKPTEDQKSVYSATLESVRRMTRVAKPGVTGEELFEIGFEPIEKAGYPYSGVRYGHELGLSMVEGMSIERGVKEKLSKGVYLMIHPNIYQKNGNCAILGDGVMVTNDGCKVLTKTPYTIQV